MHSQERQNIGNSEAASDKGDFFKLNILSKNQLGEMLNIKAKITEIGGESEEEDSMCCDSNLQNLVDGIVGIIEGFGLLDYNIPESAIDEISEQIVSLVNLQGDNADTDNSKDYIKMLSEIIARMPNTNQNESLNQETKDAIQKLIDEYQCSFDNTNNTGVNETELKNEPEQIDADRIKNMLKVAIKESKGTKIKQFGLTNEKASDEVKSKDDVGKTNGSSMLFRTSSETAKTTEIQQNQNVEQAAGKDMAENIAKITQKITSSQIDGKREFDVTLKPSFLGKLSIKLVMDGDSIKAHIKAADQYVKGLISEQLPELSQALKEKGVNMTHIEVVYDSPMSSSTDQQFHGQNQNMGDAGKSMRSFAAEKGNTEIIAFSAVTDQTDLFLKNSSVEFSA